ncbi:hypothetical protein BBJ29_007150 [Phytophthora kernoviae]|uniref:RxLR effector protein n=1 Tax=Phytophthora kernoviae TaxID=325452 RepID=A0A3R7HIY6_9STRA|nr:hypothetical protein BBJ29_007150 [Phytophthora kernoviae]
MASVFEEIKCRVVFGTLSGYVVRSLESNDEPKRLLRSYKEDDGGDDDDDDDDDDEEEEEEEEDEEYGSLDSVDEERALTFNNAKFNKMLQDSTVANKNYVTWFENGMSVKAVKDLLRVENNTKYNPLVRAFKAFRKTQQGRAP